MERSAISMEMSAALAKKQ